MSMTVSSLVNKFSRAVSQSNIFKQNRLLSCLCQMTMTRKQESIFNGSVISLKIHLNNVSPSVLARFFFIFEDERKHSRKLCNV